MLVEHFESTSAKYRLVPLEIKQRKRKSRTLRLPIALDIPWLTVLLGFFLARALLLDELLPFGIAFIAAVYRGSKPRPMWALLGIIIGYTSLAPFSDLYPYHVATYLLWFVGINRKLRQKDSYWVFWILFALFVVKSPLTIAKINANYPMLWFAAASESIIAIAAYNTFSDFIIKKRVYVLETKEFQLGLLLIAALLGVELQIGELSLRIMLLCYLVLAAARIGGIKLALMAGSSFSLISLLLQLPLELAILVVVVAVFAGFFAHLPAGLLLAGSVGFLLTFGLPVTADAVPYLIMLAIAAIAVYLTPASKLRQMERFIPGTKKYQIRQASHAARAQVILEQRVDQFSQVFSELAAALGGNPFVAQQLENLAEVIRHLGTEFSTQVEFAEAVEAKLWDLLDSPDLEELTVLQQRNSYYIAGRLASPCGERWCDHAAQVCEQLLGSHFTVVRRNCLLTGECGFDICTKARYVLDVKTAKVAQAKVSGDSTTVFPLSANRVGLLISDGMGTGERAAEESMATVRLLEKMLRIGYDPEVAVRVINQTLLARSSNDTFATIDFAVIDLQAGRVEFIKIGSAPSFIKRNNSIEVIQNHALPIGILNHVEVEPERHLLCEDEFLIMVTDGVLDAKRDAVDKEAWFAHLIRRCHYTSCQDLANYLLMQSIEAAGGTITDDMMVLVAKLVRYDPEIYPYQRS